MEVVQVMAIIMEEVILDIILEIQELKMEEIIIPIQEAMDIMETHQITDTITQDLITSLTIVQATHQILIIPLGHQIVVIIMVEL